MISVSQALATLINTRATPPIQIAPLSDILGAICAGPINAKVTLPPQDVSAMDGYAAKFDDARHKGAALNVIGEAPAGKPFHSQIGKNECVRIFTGSVIPEGADTVIIQENVTRIEDIITINERADTPRHIRKAGIDFKVGDAIAQSGESISPAHIALFAASNHAQIPIYKRPRIAIIANGDELRMPGSHVKTGQIINSNPPFLAALLEQWGAEPVFMGIAKDSKDAICELINTASDADIIVPVGGASVGDHDHMRSAFADCGLKMIFQKIAVKPGKPTWFGKLGTQHVLGLPGNPASAAVCAHLFLKPLITGKAWSSVQAVLTQPLSSNGPRESFLRALLSIGSSGRLEVTPFPKQDSSLITPLVKANALIQLAPHNGPWDSGDMIDVVPLKTGPDIL